MKQLKLTTVALFLSWWSPVPSSEFAGVFLLAEAQAEENKMGKVSLLLKKLRTSMAGIKDLDQLEKSGMSKKEVDRMRRAMERKIQQLTEESIASIHAL